MIALKNTTNNQIFYIIHKKMDGKSDGYGLTTLDVEYTENGQYSINPPSGYDGLSKVNVTVDVEKGNCNLTTSTVTITGDGEHTITPPEGYDGFSEVVVNVENDCEDAYENGVADQKAKLTSATFTENGTYNREDGWNTVQVNVDTVTPYNEGVEDGKDAQKALMTNLTAVSNGTYNREDGYNEVIVNVPSDVNNQNKQITYTQNGTQQIIADNGYSGLGQVDITVDVDTITPYNEGKLSGIQEQKSKLTELQVTQNGEYTREDGYNRVVVDVDLDGPYNEGREDGIEEQKAKLTDITIVSNGTYNRQDGYNNITVAVPSDINNQNKTVNPLTTQQNVIADQGYSGLGQVTVNAVTAAIDPNIQPSNIKKDVEVLGIVGTYDPQPDLEAKTVTYTSNGTYTISPTTGDGLSSAEVTVNVDTVTPYNNGYTDGEAAQKAKLGSLSVTSNGTYTSADGYSTVVVNVQCGTDLQLSRETIKNKSDETSYPIGIYSTDDWTITSKPSWVTVDSNSGSAGTSVIMITIDSFEEGREGTITISNGSVTKTIVIEQSDYVSEYLTFEATSPGTLNWKQYGVAHSRVLQYSWNGQDWFNCTSTQTNNGCKVADLSVGDKIMLKSTTSYTVGSDNYHYFVFTNGLRGNVYGEMNEFEKPYNLFRDCTGIISAEHLIIPAGYNCSGMFRGCTGLTTAPKTLPSGYYSGMFQGCTSLVNAPELPATELTRNCYYNMFRDCTSLAIAPELPATTLVQGCYNYMFSGCTNLNYIKAMFTTTPSDTYTSSWTYNVASTGTFVKNSAATWEVTGANGIPSGWTVQTV